MANARIPRPEEGDQLGLDALAADDMHKRKPLLGCVCDRVRTCRAKLVNLGCTVLKFAYVKSGIREDTCFALTLLTGRQRKLSLMHPCCRIFVER